jgi:hypothetical protein
MLIGFYYLLSEELTVESLQELILPENPKRFPKDPEGRRF